MKIPSEVVWQLTKRWNSSIVKFNGQSFSSDPLNLTNFHNASSAGSNNHAVGISAVKEQGKKVINEQVQDSVKEQAMEMVKEQEKNMVKEQAKKKGKRLL